MNINFYKYRIFAFVFSITILLFSTILFAYKSLNLGIDFKGGIMIEAKFSEIPVISELTLSTSINPVPSENRHKEPSSAPKYE